MQEPLTEFFQAVASRAKREPEWTQSVVNAFLLEQKERTKSGDIDARTIPFFHFSLDFFSNLLSLFSRFLPAAIAYGLACVRGDLQYRIERVQRQETTASVAAILGNQLSAGQISCVVRDSFRLRSCEEMDLARLNGSGAALIKLVEIRGLQNIKAAMADGRGAMLVGAHFGSYQAALSLLGAMGLPVTIIWRPEDTTWIRSAVELSVYRALKKRRHFAGSIVEQRPGSINTAVRVAKVLKANGLVGVILEPPVLAEDRKRAMNFEFLGKQALLLPDFVGVAQATEVPMLMFFMRRSSDWRHQILNIAAPMEVGTDPLAAFRKMLSITEKAIKQNPAHWVFWSSRESLVEMGLLKDVTSWIE